MAGAAGIDAALERAAADVTATRPPERSGRQWRRRAATGDPQGPFRKFLDVLDRHSLLDDAGRIPADAQLVSIGDHFDWGTASARREAATDARRLLAWLAAHPPDQVVLLAGNHDLARVGELLSFSDDSWRAAQLEADAVAASGGAGGEAEAAFLRGHPALPSAEIASRDFATFEVAQRDLVIRLLEAGRFRLAFAPARDLLLTHAGITTSDLARIGIGGRDASDAIVIADVLNDVFDRAVKRWLMTDRGQPLHIPALHHAGSSSYGESRGILTHRPANPDSDPDRAWFNGPLRKRFDPRWLPGGLTQAIGHIRDEKCRKLLGAWADADPATDGPLRHLRSDGSTVRYARGAPPRAEREALMLFLDGGLLHAQPEGYEPLDLDTRSAARPRVSRRD